MFSFSTDILTVYPSKDSAAWALYKIARKISSNFALASTLFVSLLFAGYANGYNGYAYDGDIINPDRYSSNITNTQNISANAAVIEAKDTSDVSCMVAYLYTNTAVVNNFAVMKIANEGGNSSVGTTDEVLKRQRLDYFFEDNASYIWKMDGGDPYPR
ncbi:MAG: hypothetical protein LBQ18_08060 [Campylobacteraceae bacterium]|jgi:hypothetical protein|nr:hypothetical protein [Campylobacteraceae bacterium]